MSGKPVTLLLVEDDVSHAELILLSLREHRIPSEVVHIKDGEAAIDYLFRKGRYANPISSPRPDVVVLDLRLPKIDGLTVLKEIKGDEKLRDIPVVILTTSQAEKDLSMAYENNANSYLVKPVDFGKFMELMDLLGFYWLAWNRHP